MHEPRSVSHVGGPQPGAPLRSFDTIIFDTRGDQRIVRITVPYRFARLFGRGAGFRWLGELTFLDDTEFDPEGTARFVNCHRFRIDVDSKPAISIMKALGK